MNMKTLRATLRQIDPSYRISREPDRLSVMVAGKTVTIGGGNALAMMTRGELKKRIQRALDERLPHLLATPAAVRWISAEPLLGPVDLSCWPIYGPDREQMLNWVVVGGESGANARPMHPEWARSLRDQCAAAGVPFLFKQWGEHMPADADDCDPGIERYRLFWSDGVPWSPDDGQRDGVLLMARVGKKAAGRLLDGVQHDVYPEGH